MNKFISLPGSQEATPVSLVRHGSTENIKVDGTSSPQPKGLQVMSLPQLSEVDSASGTQQENFTSGTKASTRVGKVNSVNKFDGKSGGKVKTILMVKDDYEILEGDEGLPQHPVTHSPTTGLNIGKRHASYDILTPSSYNIQPESQPGQLSMPLQMIASQGALIQQ